MSQEDSETTITSTLQSPSPILNNRKTKKKWLRPLARQTVDLPKLYKDVLAHVAGKIVIQKSLLKYYLELLNKIPVESCRSLLFVKKIKGLLQYALKSSKAFNHSLSEGEVMIMESPCSNFRLDELQRVYREISQHLRTKSKFLPRKKLKTYLDKYSHCHNYEGETLELILKIRGILKYLLLNRSKFIAQLETADITLVSGTGNLSECGDQVSLINGHDETPDAPPEMSNNNYDLKENIDNESYQEVLHNSKIFQTPLLPSAKFRRQDHQAALGIEAEKMLKKVNKREIKTDDAPLSCDMITSDICIDTCSLNFSSVTDTMHQESQQNFEIFKALHIPSIPNDNLSFALDLHEDFENTYMKNYKLALNFKTNRSEIDVNSNSLLNTHFSNIFENQKVSQNKFQSQISLKEAAMKVREIYDNDATFVTLNFVTILDQLSISEGKRINDSNLISQDITMSELSFDVDLGKDLTILQDIRTQMKNRMEEKNCRYQ